MYLPALRLTFIAVALALAAPLARSQSFPAKPVRVIVGFAPGGIADLLARIAADKLGEIMGTSVVVDNRPGAGGGIAAGFVAKSPADGYTLLLCNAATHGINPALYKNLAYDPVKDFAPISNIGWAPNVLIVHPSVPVTSVREFIAYAKANPGRITVASAGVGTSQHLSTELFKWMTDIDVISVPYKGGGPALADLLGAQVPAAMTALSTSITMIKAGKVRALGVTSAKRSAQLPDLPTIGESGVAGFEVVSWNGLCAPAGVPKPVLARLNADLVKTLNMPETQDRLAAQGVQAEPMTPEQFAAYIESEIARWAAVVKRAGIAAQ